MTTSNELETIMQALLSEGLAAGRRGLADELTRYMQARGYDVLVVGDGLLGISYTLRGLDGGVWQRTTVHP